MYAWHVGLIIQFTTSMKLDAVWVKEKQREKEKEREKERKLALMVCQNSHAIIIILSYMNKKDCWTEWIDTYQIKSVQCPPSIHLYLTLWSFHSLFIFTDYYLYMYAARCVCCVLCVGYDDAISVISHHHHHHHHHHRYIFDESVVFHYFYWFII